MKPNEKTQAAVLYGVIALCLLLLILATRELLVVVRVPALVLEPLPSILRMFCLSFMRQPRPGARLAACRTSRHGVAALFARPLPVH